MKKIFTTMVMALMLMAIPAQAQLKWGITGGLNMTKMSYSGDASTDIEDASSNKSGFFIGPTVNFTLPIVGIGIDASALYDQREAKGEDVTYKSQSIQIPVNVRYGIGLGSLASVFAFAGPQFGFNIGGDKTIMEAGQEVGNWTLRSSNISINLGIGAMVAGHLQAKLNYNIAMGKTGEFDYTDQVATTLGVAKNFGDAKANAWQLSVAYFF